MLNEIIEEIFGDKIAYVLSCNDWLVYTTSISEISNCQGLTSYLYRNNVKIFDYTKFAEPFKEAIQANAERIVKEHNAEIGQFYSDI